MVSSGISDDSGISNLAFDTFSCSTLFANKKIYHDFAINAAVLDGLKA